MRRCTCGAGRIFEWRTSRIKPYPTIRSFALAALLAISLPPSPSEAVSISFVPDGPTTIEIGETVNVDVFLVLDAADQVAGIDAATLELGSAFVDVVGSSSDSVFPVAVVNVYAPKDFIAFAQFGVAVASPTALLGSLSITGRAQGSYALVGRRFADFPLFTAPGDRPPVNRYDFASNEALDITVTCGAGACPIADPVPTEPTPPPPPPVVPDLPPEEPPLVIAEPLPEPPPGEEPAPEIAGPPADDPPVIIPPPPDRCEPGRRGQCNLVSRDGITLTTITTTDTGSFANTMLNTLTETLASGNAAGAAVVPEPSTFALLGVALAGLMLISRRRASR